MITLRNSRETVVQCLYVLFAGVLVFGLPPILHAQVNVDELEKGKGQVEFQNYTGPVTRVDTRAQIRGIGYPLGTAIRAGGIRSGSEGRYFVIHAVSPPEGTKLDADILGLGPGVGVDHIRNLRLIIQGYLEGAYNYSAQDAGLLAEYITVYNAVFRGDWNYFEGIYKRGVLQYLTREKVGISTRFDEWPGKTLLVIPLGRGGAGSLSALDTSSLSDPRVIDKIREDEAGGGIEQRTAMADLKDREADEADEAARRQREAIAAEEARIAAEQDALAAEQERLAREREQAEQDAAEGRIGLDEAERRKEELAAQEEAARKKEQELADQERALAEQREAARRAEDFANQKRAEAEGDRQSIAKDQGKEPESDPGIMADAGDPKNRDRDAGDQDNTESGAENPQDREDAGGEGQDKISGAGDPQDQEGDEADQNKTGSADEQEDQAGGFIVKEDGQTLGLVGMAITDATSPFGLIVKVHPSTGKELQRSSLDTVNVRTVIFLNNKIIALAGQSQRGNTMRLVEIDPDTLEMTKQGNEDIHHESLLWVKGNNLYAIISSEGNLYLARFDTALTLQAQSRVTVHPYAAINFQGEMLIVTQRSNGQTLLLDPMDLTEGR